MLRNLILFLFVAGLVAVYVGYGKYQDVFSPNVPKELKNQYLHIPTNSTFQEVVDLLVQQSIIMDTASFTWVAERMNYIRPQMRAGRFKIEPRWNNRQLIRHLRGGKQAPVKVVLNNERLPEDIAGKVAQFIETDSISLYRLLTNEDYLDQHGYTRETVISAFIPNTYEFYWNTNEKTFFERMLKEHDKFWSQNNRQQKAKTQKLSPEEVYTLASIVQRETSRNDEKARIAGVYLNRIKKGMRLQADPTVVFATRDFNTRRVTNRHLAVESPYNTYKYTGLPPGPISMADISTLDAILNAEDHNYIFFCAKGDGSGYHAFAQTLSGHNANAARYKRNLKKRGLR
ncbi:MAG: endolytic transglycosylase MltG [Bacteroidota bacterium]